MGTNRKIVVIPGDGIGQEVTAQGIRLLQSLEKRSGLRFIFEEHAAGGTALRKYDKPILEETLQAAQSCDAVLFGAVGDPAFDRNPSHLKPEQALLQLRMRLGVYCNLRPAKMYPELINASSLRSEVITGIDIMVVRELTGGLYYGKPAEIRNENGIRVGVNTMVYSEPEIRRIAIRAFEIARKRRKKLTSVDKSNVLIVSSLWREVVQDVAKGYPDVTLENMLVDNCAMQLVRNPRQFDVILTENTFGDILSDEASMLTGSIGMLPSASLGDGPGMYEPVHGSAPDIAGKNIANPIGMLNTVGMMLSYSFGMDKEALAIDNAIAKVLSQKYHTSDITMDGGTKLKTTEFVDKVIEEIARQD